VSGHDEVVRTLELLQRNDVEGARRALEELAERSAERERGRAQAFAALRHDVGNALSIAQANIEGMLDGVLTQTPERLRGIREALRGAGHMLDDAASMLGSELEKR
jgi:hypothetical protein